MSNLQKSVLKSRLPPCGPPPRSSNGPVKKGRQKDYTPNMWDDYFQDKKDVRVNETNVFRVYLSRPPTPQQQQQQPQSTSSPSSSSSPITILSDNGPPLVVLLHGGGYSALTWAHFSTELTSIINCQCLAIDLRGHGDSYTNDDNNLSAEVLANDVAQVLSTMYHPDHNQPIMIVGHSMGGAICVHLAHLELLPTLLGCVVIDVVEGTAMEALASMQSFLRSRPKDFKSIQTAIEWSIRSGQIRNVDSAKVSMPGQIINSSTGKLATNELPLSVADAIESSSKSVFNNPIAISEESELEIENLSSLSTAQETPSPAVPSSATGIDTDSNKKYTWRIDLAKTEKFWPGWFEGLSQKFLDLRVPKLLLLASIDGLDRTLTVGQMQGKFQMQVLARCGHVVHEDRPHEVAEVIASYMVRNKFAEPTAEFHRQMPAC